ncbi:hypothetical protein AB6E53_17915, partial [Vibrio breoganii]
ASWQHQLRTVIAEVSYRQPLSWYVLRFPLTTCGNDGFFTFVRMPNAKYVIAEVSYRQSLS